MRQLSASKECDGANDRLIYISARLDLLGLHRTTLRDASSSPQRRRSSRSPRMKEPSRERTGVTLDAGLRIPPTRLLRTRADAYGK
jgi:hypothetical protein